MNATYVRAITFTVGTCLVLAGIGAFRVSRRNVRAESAPGDFTAVDDYLTTRMETAHTPGLLVAIVKGDQLVYLKGYGRADPSGRAVTPHPPSSSAPSARPSRPWP